jgi:hypothetical protein
MKNLRKDEIYVLLGYHTAYTGNSYPTFQDNLSVPSSRNHDILNLEDGNYHYTLRNNQEERRSHRHPGGSVKSRKILRTRIIDNEDFSFLRCDSMWIGM